MSEAKSQGLLLQAIPYLGTGRILKVFSREAGLISLFTKKKTLGSLASPFCIGEWIYRKRPGGDLYTLQDASLIDPLLGLRHSFHCLSAAGLMAQDILKSQLPIETSPALYDLLCSYFKQLHSFLHPEILSTSFRLKLLLHEGLLSLTKHCSHCPHAALHLSEGESFCSFHAPLPSIEFTQIEWEQLHLLAFASKFSLLHEIQIQPLLIEKSSILLNLGMGK